VAHTALARKYRPRHFAEVATQEHVSETLRRAVSGNRVAHAYLFCGPRGVGKTTLARVLAMALNCADRTEEGEPCGTCDSCQRIWSGHTSLDVVEIDAASNRGVDDARELRERAMYAPSEEGRYKVYIVDEAHMLTREAWNALLKILEEPPPRVIFVFATTEPQKIQQSAAPILSRCQRFDFRRIGVTDIVDRLREVLAEEGAAAPDEAIRILARKADGGMRDALSLLDQVLALTGGDVTQEAVRRVLGLVEEERYLELLDILVERRHGAVFGFIESLLEEGYDLAEFYQGLVETLRILLRLRLQGDGEIPGLRPELAESFGDRAGAFDPPDLVRMLAMAAELEVNGSLRRSAQPRLLLEMLLLRLSHLDRTVELEELIRGLGGSPVVPSGDRERGGGVGGGGGAREGGAEASREASGAGPEAGSSGAPRASGGSGASGTPEASGAPGPSSPSARSSTPSPPTAGATPAPGAEAARSDADSSPTEGDLEDGWARLLATGEGVPAGLLPFLRAARARSLGGNVIQVSLPTGPGLDRLEEPVVRRGLADAITAVAGREVELRVVEREGDAERSGTRISPETVRQDRLRHLLAREPLLERAVEELDLELLD